jgi:hypothetical protein
MNLSWASIAKYETTHPPKGEQLIRLMEATLSQAKKSPEPRASALRAIADRFESLYGNELVIKANTAIVTSSELAVLAKSVTTAFQATYENAVFAQRDPGGCGWYREGVARVGSGRERASRPDNKFQERPE